MRSTTLTLREHGTGRAVLLVVSAIATTLALALIAMLASASLLAVSACAQPVERYLLPAGRIEICDLAGTVRLTAGTGTRVEVFVTRGGPDGARLRIVQDQRGDEARLHVIYPGNRVVYPRTGGWESTNLTVGPDGCLGHQDRPGFGGHRVSIARSGFGLHAWADVEVRLPRGCRTTFRLGVGDVTARDVDGDLSIDVAAAPVNAGNTAGSLLVDTGSGAVTLSGHHGDLSVDTGSGAIEMSDVHGGRIKLDTGSGGVSARAVEAGDLLVDTGSGAVDLDGVRSGGISVDTGSGGVRVGLASAPRSLLVDTGSGGVTITGPAELGAEVDLETGSGGIRSDYTMTVLSKDHDSLRGTIGDGRGRIKVDAGSGAVSLLKR